MAAGSRQRGPMHHTNTCASARNEYVSQACAGSRCRTLPMAAAAASAIFQRMTSRYRAQKSAGGLPSLFAVRPVEWSTSSYNWKFIEIEN
jgi:hypothetical protein